MEQIKITLPLPHHGLRPNTEEQRAWIKSSLILESRKRAKQVALKAIEQSNHTFPWHESILQPIWFNRTNNQLDRDNILTSLKSSIDGIAEAGLIKNDRDLFPLPAVRKIDPDNPRVELIFFNSEEMDLKFYLTPRQSTVKIA
jgi:Holliday junction resolvase RusA-like endonuclease